MGSSCRMVNFLAHGRVKSTDCGVYLRVENIVIPAAERLLRLEAGRTAVLVHSRFFQAFPTKV